MDFFSQLMEILFPDFTSYITGAPLVLAFLLLGAVIGFLTGFLGLGGGFLITPLMNILLGVPYEIAVGSSLSFIIGTSFFGFLKQAKENTVNIPVAVCIGLGSSFGTFAGDILQDIVLIRFAGGDTQRFTLILHSIYIIMLTTIIFVMRNKAAGSVPMFQRRGGRFQIYLNGHDGPSVSLLLLLITGLLLGILNGFMGIGGGVLMVPVLMIFVGLEPVRASATSIFIVFISTVMATLKKGFSDIPKISMMITFCLLISSFIGVQLGIGLLKKVKSETFSRFFIYILLIALLLILVDIIRILNT